MSDINNNHKGTIGFLIHQISNHGGTERVTIEYANKLSERGYKVYVFSCRKGDITDYKTIEGVELISLEGENHPNPISRKIESYKKLKGLVVSKKIGVMIAVDVMLYPYIYFLQKKHFCKGIAWEHFNFHGKELFGRTIRKIAAANADYVVVLGQQDLSSYKANCRRIRNVIQIYNPNSFKFSPDEKQEENVVLSVGRLEDQKGYDMLLKSWKKVENVCSDWELIIVGEGSKEDALKKQIADDGLKNVRIESFIKDNKVFRSFYGRAQLYVMSSRYEGFPQVLIEAQTVGLPIVSFDCKEGPGELVKDGVNGFLVPEGRTDIMAQKIIEVLKNDELRKRFASHAGDDLDRFREDRILEKWDMLLNKLLGICEGNIQ